MMDLEHLRGSLSREKYIHDLVHHITTRNETLVQTADSPEQDPHMNHSIYFAKLVEKGLSHLEDRLTSYCNDLKETDLNDEDLFQAHFNNFLHMEDYLMQTFRNKITEGEKAKIQSKTMHHQCTLGQSEVHENTRKIGVEGGVITSSLIPQAQVEIPKGALIKPITVCLQVEVISPEVITKHLGSPSSIGPIVTVDPRRRKFRRKINVTIPFEKAWSESAIRLLYSHSEKGDPDVWEDITDAAHLYIPKDKGFIKFATTVTARFWLMNCTSKLEAEQIASTLYIRNESNSVYRPPDTSDIKHDSANNDFDPEGSQESSFSSKTLRLERRPEGLGFSVIGGRTLQDIVPVVVEEVFPNGSAADDGRLQPGDQILAVNGESLEGLTYEQAVCVLKNACDKVVLTVAGLGKPFQV